MVAGFWCPSCLRLSAWWSGGMQNQRWGSNGNGNTDGNGTCKGNGNGSNKCFRTLMWQWSLEQATLWDHLSFLIISAMTPWILLCRYHFLAPQKKRSFWGILAFKVNCTLCIQHPAKWQTQNEFQGWSGRYPEETLFARSPTVQVQQCHFLLFVCFWLSNHRSINFYYFCYILSIASKDISAFRGWWARENWERRPERVFINTRRFQFQLKK